MLVDWLDLTIPVHHVAKYVKGEWLHCFTQGTGTAVSENTGEVFTIKEIAKQDNNVSAGWEYVANIHFNALGSSGTRYIVFATLYWDGRVENSRSVCH